MAIFFLAGRIRVFIGVLGKAGGESVVLMVKTWWNAGESWCVDNRFSGLKIMPLTLSLFWVIPVLGMVGGGFYSARGVLELKFDGELCGAGSA